MNQTDILKNKLLSLKDEVNQAAGKEILSFNQQSKVQENMSYSGCNGRLWIQPSIEGYDISLSGASVEKELTAIEKKIVSRKSKLSSSSKSSQDELESTQKQIRSSEKRLARHQKKVERAEERLNFVKQSLAGAHIEVKTATSYSDAVSLADQYSFDILRPR